MRIKLSQEELERIEQNRWLTDTERKVFELYYRRGWHRAEVAAEIDRCETTVDQILRRIRRKNGL